MNQNNCVCYKNTHQMAPVLNSGYYSHLRRPHVDVDPVRDCDDDSDSDRLDCCCS